MGSMTAAKSPHVARAVPKEGGDVEETRAGLLSIGQVASRLEVSERTLRYYEELGLLTPAAHPPGRIRRYDESAIARVTRIKELRELLGFNLDEVGSILANEDRLQVLRDEYRSKPPAPARRAELLAESLALQEQLRAKVVSKACHLKEFLAELDARMARVRELAGLPEPDREA